MSSHVCAWQICYLTHTDQSIKVLPILPRQSHPLYRIPLGQHRRPLRPFPPTHSNGPRLVHRSVLSVSEPLNFPSLIDLTAVCYSLGIYLLNLFLAFLQPKFDPSLTQDEGIEDGDATLPTKQDEEFRPFIRRLPEFKFWHSATRAILLCFVCTWFQVFNLPVFWPVLVVYFFILFSLTSKYIPFFPNPNSHKNTRHQNKANLTPTQTVRRQIQHMIKYRYVPFSFGKARYNQRSGH